MNEKNETLSLEDRIKKYKLPRTFNIPAKLALNNDIPDEYKALYGYIEFRSGGYGYVWHENQTLAEHIGKSVKAVERGLTALEKANWIIRKRHVKKSHKLYHQDMTRVIWIREEYDKALAIGSSYSPATPLAFEAWKKKFVDALLDETRINFVAHFMPTLEYMGSLRVSFDVVSQHFYRTVKKNDKLEVINMTAIQAEETYKVLYKFYCEQHQNPTQIVPPPEKPQEQLMRFDILKKHIRDNYVDKTIFTDPDGNRLTVNGFGLLIRVDQDGQTHEIKTDKALELWEYIYDHQDEILKEEH